MTEVIRDIYLTNAQQKKEWAAFLADLGLANFSEQELGGIEAVIGLYDDDRLVGTGAIAGQIIKYVAVCDRGAETKGARFNRVITALENRLATLGRFHHFVFTKPRYITSFEHIGFRLLAESDLGAILEKGSPDVTQYLADLPKPTPEMQRVAAVVINANPLTNGHRYLVTQAARENERVYVFVVTQDASLFHTSERLALVKAGLADLPNVVVVGGGDYMVSYLTFPAYFMPADASVIDYQTTLDARLFKNLIAPACHITTRYVGDEPQSRTTARYNATLARELAPEIKLVVVPRLQTADHTGVISARTVRQAIAAGKRHDWIDLVPATTDQWLQDHLASLQERIRKGQEIHGN